MEELQIDLLRAEEDYESELSVIRSKRTTLGTERTRVKHADSREALASLVRVWRSRS